MEKRGLSILSILIVIILITSISSIIWIIMSGEKETNEAGKLIIPNQSEPIQNSFENTSNLNQTETNETIETSQTNINQTETNETIINQTTENNIPNPTGSITIIERTNENSEYFCSESENPQHKIRLYTYRIIEGIKNISEEYIESAEKTSVCSLYPNINITLGMNYELEWKWTPVENVDGYRIYQYYYKNENVSRDFDHYVELKKEATRLIDTDLNLWQQE
jgi:hypothetical protein